MKTEELLFLLLRFSLCGEQVKEKIEQHITREALDSLLALSQSHDLAHLVGDALGKMGLLGQDESSRGFKSAAMLALQRHMKRKAAYTQACAALAEVRIAFIPLKGSVLRERYPEAWMRTSCDIDILVKEEDLPAAVSALEAKGFQNKGRSFYDVSFYSPQGVHLELHFNLITDAVSEKQAQILSQLWECVIPVDGSECQWAMPDEMFYFYHIAHMAKHVKAGGCGIRPVLDIWILNNRIGFDVQARQKLLKKGDLLVFAGQMERLAEAWLGTGKMDAPLKNVAAFILHNGMYGSYEARVVLREKENQGVRYVLHRIFLPYRNMKYHYPILQRHKWLLPFCEVARWGRLALNGGIKRSSQAIQAKHSVPEEERTYMLSVLETLGL